ncbi:PKD domain-containing protein [Sediminitomix flava]|uniref:PKD domain-containing protein n=1 Tax=Sediminitomix flava TaxID=379075 RepID=A0A315Z7S3_SEDFL|nr:PKD domain-containing protein [Sediminitomix flava]PWJ40204.1 PKD domain-containing protein [Sediminitomix flava]
MKIRLVILLLAPIGFLFTNCTEDSAGDLPPTPTFTASQTFLRMGETVVFQNTSDDAEKYIWDFGDGSAKEELKDKFTPVQHTFTNVGNFHVYLTSVSSSGEEVESSMIIRVGILELQSAELRAYPLMDTIDNLGQITEIPWDEDSGPDLRLAVLKSGSNYLLSDLYPNLEETDLPLTMSMSGFEQSGFWLAGDPFIITTVEEDTVDGISNLFIMNSEILVETPFNELQRSTSDPLSFSGDFETETSDLEVSLQSQLYLFTDTVFLQQSARKQKELQLPKRIEDKLNQFSM